jgi:GTP-binding protein HflX
MPAERPKAVLVSVKLPEVDAGDFESSLEELTRLVTTLGYDVVRVITQQRSALSPGAVLGEGKLRELSELTGGSGNVEPSVRRHKNKAQLKREAENAEFAPQDGSQDSGGPDEEPESESTATKIELVAVDHELSPSQIRNLERATSTTVVDRTGVIIEIFHRHAHSPKARLEVEIARLTYAAPRLRESPRGKERQQGRGAGEAALELDRRRVRDRIAELREQVEAIQREEGVRRAHRRGARRVALVGYTNAGKSSWMRALTGSQVLVENKLFATLDTTVRALQPEAKPRILVSDTVGFIKKLPHDLVASFKSTLDEAMEASLLLYVVDAADPNWESQLAITRDVLREIGADELPSRVLLNKADRLTEAERAEFRADSPEALLVSNRDPGDVARVRTALIEFFESFYIEGELFVPYDRQRLVSQMHDSGNVLEQSYEDTGVRVRLRADPETLNRLRAELG